jgi:hypothetical protein
MLLSSIVKKTLHSSKIFISYISYEITSILNHYITSVITIFIMLLALTAFC